jgi:hypothetical protein
MNFIYTGLFLMWNLLAVYYFSTGNTLEGIGFMVLTYLAIAEARRYRVDNP